MLAEIPIISPIFQGLLDALGWVLAWLYDIIPNYGVAIIILTLVLRFLLFPLGMKQIKSMQAMQALQPKIKEIQKKYKGNKQKAQEETMRLYKEAGVNPLGGCLPVLAQFPLLIAMYAVLRAPGYEPVTENDQVTAYVITNNHLPTNSALFASVVTHEGTGFLGLNLQCSASQAGSVENSTIKDSQGNVVKPGLPLEDDDGQPLDSFESKPVLPCGTDGLTSKIGYVLLLGLMIATSFYQTLQTQRASPQGAASNQQQMILRIMPLFFGFIGFSVPRRPGAVLDRVEPVYDRPADAAPSGGPHRTGGPGPPDGGAEGQRWWPRPKIKPQEAGPDDGYDGSAPRRNWKRCAEAVGQREVDPPRRVVCRAQAEEPGYWRQRAGRS